MRLRFITKALIYGVVASAALAGISLMLAGHGIPYLMLLLVYSGVPLSLLLPDAFVYWLYPEGGGMAFAGIAFISAIMQSAVIIAFSVFIYFRHEEKKNEPN